MTPYDHIAGRFHTLRTTLEPKELEYLSLLLDPLPPGSTILDLGCGTGQPVAAHIASRGQIVVGVDSSEAMLAFARSNLPQHRWIHALIEEVEFDETFAAVVCWDSSFHLPRRHHEPLIHRIHSWLMPGGRFMISSGGAAEESGNGFTDTMFGHEFYYDSLSPGQMTAVIEHAGFEILRSEMCDPPDGIRNRGKWATVASKRMNS
jgi:cyclopropane fatty-acyl-phospholipid synthase-like methyltransferase